MTTQRTASSSDLSSVTTPELDHLLTAQFAIAWAGEGGEQPRLGWWRTELCCEDGGEDLFARLLPNTHAWAALQAARETARRTDRRMRGDSHDPDQLVSLYRLGFVLDERAEERLADLKRSGKSPVEALPALKDILGHAWSRQRFTTWVTSHGKPNTVNEPIGVRIRGAAPASLRALVDSLVAAHDPFPDAYPLPHYRSE